MDHWHHYAYLWGDNRAVAGLLRLSPRITEARVIPAPGLTLRRPILCVDIASLCDAPDGLREEIAGIDSTAFDAFLRSNPVPTWDDDDDERVFQREQARVRAMIWLSREISDPVGYWYHEGDNGMVADHFLGFGGSTAMWANQRLRQGPGWDESKPRSAYTAALWHIGARELNLDEYDSLGNAFCWPQVPIHALSEESMLSLVALIEHYRGRLHRLPGYELPPPPPQISPLRRTASMGWFRWIRKLLGRGLGY